MSGTTKQQDFIQFQTYFFEFLDIEKNFYVNGRLIVSMDGGDFHGWDRRSDEGVCRGHSRGKKARV